MFETVGIVAKQNDPRVGETCRSLVAYLRARAIPHLLDPVSAAAVPESPDGGTPCEVLGQACDLVIVVGGDGTLLKTARLLIDYDVRLLGINLGRVGFLTDLSRHETAARLDEIFGGRFQEEIRFLLEAQVMQTGGAPVRQDALNDVVVQKGNVARLVRLDTYIDGRFVSSQRSDGLIVSTPTGSTAYALSGGGPLLHPSLNAIVLVPICPHTLSNRPIVVDADSLVEIVVSSGQATTALLTCDGDTVADLVVGDRVLVRKRDRAVRLIHPPGHDYFATLRTKLHWAKELLVLTHLEVRDLAIVAQVSLDLAAGMTVLTGETGAGKSILLDALGLVLGDRAGGAIVRPGSGRADIVAVFETRGLPTVEARLAELDLTDPDGTCVLRRTVGLDERSRAFVNGRPMPVQTLREIGELLVDIHGQHAHQALRRRDAQREVLDHFAGQEARLAELRTAWQGWQAAREAAARLGGSAVERAAERELLRYQVDELRGLALQPGEIEAIGAEHRRLSHAGALLASARRAAHALEEAEDGAVVARLETLARELAETARFDERLAPLAELLDGAAIQAREAAGGLRRYADADEVDPDRLQWLEQRIAAVEAMARKHRVPAAQLTAHLEQLTGRLGDIERGEERLAALEAEVEAQRRRYDALAEELHHARVATAPRLAEAIAANVRELGMAGARFAVEVQSTGAPEPGPTGRDRVEFLVSANPGQPLGPLAQVASGGELSRISLAIQLIGAAGRGVPTQIFDEVDSGVGGRVAEVVGSALRRLAKGCQVLCVTHLPQVAARGHHHIEVRKGVRDGETYATVTPLDGDARVGEIARMLGGLQVTDRALAHAREMLDRAAEG